MTEQEILDKWPELFTDKWFDGLCVGDGWLPIIEVLCMLMAHEAKNLPAGTPPPTIVQVKEKFGELRIYIDNATPTVYSYLMFAELMSTRTCETCGNPGKLRSGGWIKTLCDEHAKGRDNFVRRTQLPS